MKRLSHKKTSHSHRRSGLAPLELVLVTPFLVFVGALMVNFGDAALWKIRSQANVHYAMTQTQPFRASSYANDPVRNPRPQSWPSPATWGSSGGANIDRLQNESWNVPDQEETFAVQGDPIQDSFAGSGQWTKNAPIPASSNSIEVDRRMFMERGVHRGRVGVQQHYPMLSKIISPTGNYSFDNNSEQLSGDWDYGNLGLRANGYRRTFDLYGIEPDELSNFDQSLISNFEQAVQDLQGAYASMSASSGPAPINQHPVDPLDDDAEWQLYTGGSPNFHPHPRGCDLELREFLLRPASGATSPYERHLFAVRRLPRRMADSWIGMYQREIARQRGNPPTIPPQPPLPGGMDIPELEAEIANLDRFLQRLPQGY